MKLFNVTFNIYQIQVLSDGFFLTGVENFLQHRLQESLSSNTYLYLFNHKGESSFSELFLNDHESEHGKPIFIYIIIYLEEPNI